MTAILVLLALLSIATLANRRGSAEMLFNVASAPMLLAVGVILSPNGLGFLLPSTASALTPALRVAIAYLALLIGLRTRPPTEPFWLRDMAWTVLVGGATFASCGLAAWLTLEGLATVGLNLPEVTFGQLSTPMAAVLLAGMVCTTGLSWMLEATADWPHSPLKRRLLFLARHDAVFGVGTVMAAVWFWPPPADWGLVTSSPPMLVESAVGATLALAALFMGAGRDHVTTNARMALVALVLTGVGLSAMARVSEVAAIWLMGMALAWIGASGRLLSPAMRETDRPLRMVVFVLAGVHLQFDRAAIVVGLVIMLARLAAKVVIASMLRKPDGERLRFGVLFGTSALSVPYAMSLTLARSPGFSGTGLLTAVVIAVAAADLLTLLLGVQTRVRSGSAITQPVMPAVRLPTTGGPK